MNEGETHNNTFEEAEKSEEEPIEDWDKTQTVKTVSLKKSLQGSAEKGSFNLEEMMKQEIRERNRFRYVKKDPTIEIAFEKSPDVAYDPNDEIEEGKEGETVFDR